jgi:hypothetical protein
LVVCTELQLGYSVMAASIPCLKPFVTVYEKEPGQTAHSYYIDRPSNTVSSERSIKLKSLNSNLGQKHKSRASIPGSLSPTVGLQYTYTATVTTRDKKANPHDDDALSVNTQDSRRMIIERKTDWSVQYDST